jgi:hypothetical protein
MLAIYLSSKAFSCTWSDVLTVELTLKDVTLEHISTFPSLFCLCLGLGLTLSSVPVDRDLDHL